MSSLFCVVIVALVREKGGNGGKDVDFAAEKGWDLGSRKLDSENGLAKEGSFS